MPTDFAPYRKLLKRTSEISFFTSSAFALTWDLETYMPPKGLNHFVTIEANTTWGNVACKPMRDGLISNHDNDD